MEFITRYVATDKYKLAVEEILDQAGIRINGPSPWDIWVNNEEFYKKLITEGELGLGESYMDGWWNCERIDELICRALKAGLDGHVRVKLSVAAGAAMARMTNLQSHRRAFIVGEKHYDLGNDLFINMLDKRMNYSCAYWKDAPDLDTAQEHKLDLICRKIGLKQGMRVLDIGCGWGAFAKYAAEKYDVDVVGITVSKEQVNLARRLCHNLPVEIELLDYRHLDGEFDRIVSIGMFEHVGYKNYRTFFETVFDCLAPDGIFLLHTIGSMKSEKSIDPWTNKYIFPNGMLPSLAQIGSATEGLFVMHDLHNFGSYYDRTLMAWHENFINRWDRISQAYTRRFFRMWKFFLLSSAGGFRAGTRTQLWQIVMSKNGIPGGYEAVR
jgi:cyclopropane-fatty-acyl-phospholipid synthase